MSMITNFNPVQSINSFLKPFGLGVSSKQQIIAKTAMVAFAALTFNQMMMQTVNASIANAACKDNCQSDCTGRPDLIQCINACYAKCDRDYP
ncbi:MAG: hypothetical protein ACRDDW_04255 [Candidatus Rhabdochlamydia sp.]